MSDDDERPPVYAEGVTLDAIRELVNVPEFYAAADSYKRPAQHAIPVVADAGARARSVLQRLLRARIQVCDTAIGGTA